eukprot:GDKJ01058288.1.p1 GENE.GDKJ01058288.1~~GDKJ01058288.1.p1  ORF type:complete len:787 (+),score=135.26 GDKJ01058288.1:29-2362(+)
MNSLLRNLLPRTEKPAIRRYSFSWYYFTLIPIVIVLLFWTSIIVATWGHLPCNAGDRHWIDFDQHPFIKDRPENFPFKKSHYLKMRDGVDIAIDVYLPIETANDFGITNDYEAVDVSLRRPIPSFLHLTRYGRSVEVYPPFNFWSLWNESPGTTWNFWTWHLAQPLLASNYAFISVDARGTGSSFGSRVIDMSPEEVQDYLEILRWVKSQPWSDSKVATGGLSYDGMVGLQMAAHAEKGEVGAAVALFSPGDVFNDVASPGGVLATAFVYSYEAFTSSIERSGAIWSGLINDPMIPRIVTMGIQMLIKGSAPIEGRAEDLPLALAQHENNWNMTKIALEQNLMQHSDDFITTKDNRSFAVGKFGASGEIINKLYENDVAVLSVGGFYDSASVRGASRMHSKLSYRASQDGKRSKSRLILGPWGHGARRAMDPFENQGSLACFEPELHLDVVRHVDCALKGKCWGGIDVEAPVHVRMSQHPDNGGSVWQSYSQWPPQNTTYMPFAVSANRLPVSHQYELRNLELSDEIPTSSLELPAFPRDASTEHSTGDYNRYNLVHHVVRFPVFHGDRFATTAGRAQVFKSAPFKEATSLTGSPWLSLDLELPEGALDASLFAYLELVNPESGSVTLLSESQLMISHKVTKVVPLTHNEDKNNKFARWAIERARSFAVHDDDRLNFSGVLHSEDPAQQAAGSHTRVVRTFSKKAREGGHLGRRAVDFTLEHVGVTIPKGWSVRVSLAAQDSTNFLVRPLENMPLSQEWTLHAGSSLVFLPVSTVSP